MRLDSPSLTIITDTSLVVTRLTSLVLKYAHFEVLYIQLHANNSFKHGTILCCSDPVGHVDF